MILIKSNVTFSFWIMLITSPKNRSLLLDVNKMTEI